MQTSGQSISQLSTLMTVFPQVLINVPVKKKPEISSVPQLVRLQQDVETRLGERGRVLLRYSGTEPVCRIMVEGERHEEIHRYARQIAVVVRKQLS
jgi:phosphoglucosamine mutase